MRGARVFFLPLAASALIGANADTAAACSCVPPDARAQYRAADAAFAGVLENVRNLGTSQAVYRYAVRRGYKRKLGRTVWVRSTRSSAACGLPDVVGQTYALFLQRTGKHWSSGLCSVTSPDRLRRAARKSRTGGPSARSLRAPRR